MDFIKLLILNVLVKQSRLTAYYVTSPHTLPPKPGGNTKWYGKIVSSLPTPPMNTRHNPATHK
jgi:hypothetical protein